MTIIRGSAITSELSRRDFKRFAKQYGELDFTPFHNVYYSVLNEFAQKKIKNLIISVPSQHGKSEGSTRLLPPYMLGLNPHAKIAIGSYSDRFAQKFNRAIQRNIDNSVYRGIFPNTTLNSSNVVNSGKWVRNAHEFEIVDHKGRLKSVGRGGELTGDPVDVMIMDDLYKSALEGNSPTYRDQVESWYKSVVIKRLHNDSQQLIVFTRWHEQDLIGWLEENDEVIQEPKTWSEILNQGDKWVKLNFPAIMDSEKTEFDQREIGEALWEDRHSLKKHKKDRKLDPIGFECMNQGRPASKEGVLYDDFKTYKELPVRPTVRSSYTDVADTGDNYLCTIEYIYYNKLFYVLDVYYSNKKNEITEKELADLIMRNKTNYAGMESNNGGRGFCRNVERMCREMGHTTTSFKPIPQRDNKKGRIQSNASTVQNQVVFPDNWHHRFPLFYNHVTKFRSDMSSKYDDAPDVLTAIVEKRTKTVPIIYS